MLVMLHVASGLGPKGFPATRKEMEDCAMERYNRLLGPTEKKNEMFVVTGENTS